MENEIKIYNDAMDKINDLLNHAKFDNKELERQTNWVLLELCRKMLSEAIENSMD